MSWKPRNPRVEVKQPDGVLGAMILFLLILHDGEKNREPFCSLIKMRFLGLREVATLNIVACTS